MHIRILLVLSFFGIATTLATAQQKTLFDDPEIKIGGFGGVGAKVTQINNRTALLFGGGGAWVIERSFFVGGSGYSLLTEATGEEMTNGALNMGYGGVVVGYQFLPDELVHFNLQTLVGGGGVSYQNSVGGFSRENDDGFFIVEPSAEVEVNMTRHIKMGVQGSWRIVGDIELPGMTNALVSGPAAALIVKFGEF